MKHDMNNDHWSVYMPYSTEPVEIQKMKQTANIEVALFSILGELKALRQSMDRHINADRHQSP